LRTTVLFLGILLMGCQMAVNTDQTVPAGGPPFSVTYRNTTANTTGNVPVDSQTYADGATVTVLGNTGPLVWPYWTFDGWNTKDNGGAAGGGGGTFYAPNATFVIHSNTVLYGTWH
jgi:hypothetical protein